MLILKMWRAQIPPSAVPAFQRFVEMVTRELQPLLGPTRECQSRILSIDPGTISSSRSSSRSDYQTEPSPSCAEVFADGRALYVATITERTSRRPRLGSRQQAAPQPVEAYVTLSYIGTDEESGRMVDLGAQATECFGAELQPYYFLNKSFEDLRSEGREPPRNSSSEEIAGSSLLQDRYRRRLLSAIKAAGGLLVRDLESQLPPEAKERTAEIQMALRSAGLIESEIVVVCSRTQAQTARVPSRDVLTRLSEEGLRCACGRAIADERNEEALAVTELARGLLDKSRWLTLLLVVELERLGVPREHMLVEQQLGGDEIDCLVSVSGETVLFELKDKEFNLGNAYSFGAKIGITRPDYSVIISTEHVGQDAKDHFQRARIAEERSSQYLAYDKRPAEVRYIEGVENLRDGIRSAISEIYSGDAARLLNQVLPLAFPNAATILDSLQARPPLERNDTAAG